MDPFDPNFSWIWSEWENSIQISDQIDPKFDLSENKETFMYIFWGFSTNLITFFFDWSVTSFFFRLKWKLLVVLIHRISATGLFRKWTNISTKVVQKSVQSEPNCEKCTCLLCNYVHILLSGRMTTNTHERVPKSRGKLSEEVKAIILENSDQIHIKVSCFEIELLSRWLQMIGYIMYN